MPKPGFRPTKEEMDASKAAEAARQRAQRRITGAEFDQLVKEFDTLRAIVRIIATKQGRYKLRPEALAKTLIEAGGRVSERLVAYADAFEKDAAAVLTWDPKTAPRPLLTAPSEASLLRSLAVAFAVIEPEFESNFAGLAELQALTTRLDDESLTMDDRIERVMEYNATCRPEFRVTDKYWPIRGWLVNGKDLDVRRVLDVAEMWGFAPDDREQIWVDRIVAEEMRREREERGEADSKGTTRGSDAVRRIGGPVFQREVK
jgi:hypothetical protein